MATGTAIAYLIELRLRADPTAPLSETFSTFDRDTGRGTQSKVER
jgi:hypothetical protein